MKGLLRITLGGWKDKKTRCPGMLTRPLLFKWLTMKSRLATKTREIGNYGLIEPEAW